MATLKASFESNIFVMNLSKIPSVVAHFSVFTDLSYKDFKQALQDFTPPSLWGAQLQVLSGAGMESIGGLHQARQLLMDIVLLPAKVW